eukprot:TRINITY_DN6267_c0_g1_i2.p1 TRINITY_DN6267_c0_g1~~TRINITY_DN6267_c0_g1_i2.p1  ORF type:complete len:451 (+),score=131.58 TRINITY_DN6267_c0_g1_i2:692-2044(+)
MEIPSGYSSSEEEVNDPLTSFAKNQKTTVLTDDPDSPSETLVIQKEKDAKGTTIEKVSWWKAATDKVKYTFISKETEAAFGDIFDILRMFLKDLGFRPIDITLALMVIYTHHKAPHVSTDLKIIDLPLVERIHHFSKFASASYGWKLIYGYQWKKSAGGFVSGISTKNINRRILVEHTSIGDGDIIQERWTTNNTFSPGHYIAVDHSTKSVVLAIRGTFHIKDALTDLVAKYEPFKGGKAHGGILRAAKEKHAELTPILLETLSRPKDYGLVIVGHSLGAGTAALISIMIHDDYNIPLHCYAFAPPSVVSLDLAGKCKDFITSIILNDDMIPRLSYSSMEDFKHLVSHLISQKDSGKLQRMFQVMSVGNTFGDSFTKKLSNWLECNPVPDLASAKLAITDRLHPPGVIYHIYNTAELGQKARYDEMEESGPSLFSQILITSTMFTDHMPV